MEIDPVLQMGVQTDEEEQEEEDTVSDSPPVPQDSPDEDTAEIDSITFKEATRLELLKMFLSICCISDSCFPLFPGTEPDTESKSGEDMKFGKCVVVYQLLFRTYLRTRFFVYFKPQILRHSLRNILCRNFMERSESQRNRSNDSWEYATWDLMKSLAFFMEMKLFHERNFRYKVELSSMFSNWFVFYNENFRNNVLLAERRWMQAFHAIPDRPVHTHFFDVIARPILENLQESYQNVICNMESLTHSAQQFGDIARAQDNFVVDVANHLNSGMEVLRNDYFPVDPFPVDPNLLH